MWVTSTSVTESKSSAWSCHASADLRHLNQRYGTSFSMKISHLFYSMGNDWAFSYYMGWNDVQEPEKVYIKAKLNSLFFLVNSYLPYLRTTVSSSR